MERRRSTQDMHARSTHRRNASHAEAKGQEATEALDTLLNIGDSNALHVPRAPQGEHLDTQACAAIPPQ